MARRARLFGLAGCLAAACGSAGRSPESAARAFLDAAAGAQTEAVYRLLAPASLRDLDQLATRATAQAGGQRRLVARDLLVLGFARPRYEASAVELSYVDRDRAQVRLISRRDHTAELLDLHRIGGRWRVVLPRGAASFRLD